MKTLFGILALAWAAAACQPQSAPSQPVAATSPPQQPAASDSTAVVLALLRQVDLAPVVASQPDPASEARPQAMEGFFGPDHYHISFFFTKVRRDSLRPQVLHVWGLSRYKKVITSFGGTCTLTRLAPLPDTAALENSQRVRAYTVFGNFVLRESPAAKGAGVYSGRACFDFTVDDAHRAQTANFIGLDTGLGNPTKGCGVIFRGKWQSNRTGQRKAVAWAGFYEVIVPDALRKMGLGERGAEVSPELANYGWSELWENDEWWTKALKPAVL